ncbi:hypothetical protein SGLAM104S_08149 [Streptomyces glaucescens]
MVPARRPHQRLRPVQDGQHALPAQPQRLLTGDVDDVLRLGELADPHQRLREVAVPAPAGRVRHPEPLLQFPHPPQRPDGAGGVPGDQLDVAEGGQGTRHVDLVAVLLGVFGGLPGQRQRPVDVSARRLRDGGEHGGGHLADPGVPGQPQALPGQVQGPPAVPGAQFGLGEHPQEVHLALHHAAPPHLAEQPGDGGAGIGQLIAHQQPAQPGGARSVVMAGDLRILRFLEGPPDGGGGVGVAHQRLGLRLEGERQQLRAPVAAPRGQLRGVRGLFPALGEVALDDEGPPGQLVVDQGEQPGVVARVGERLREDRVDVSEGLTGRLYDHHPGPYPVGGHGRPGQHLPGDVPGEIHLARGDRVLGGLQPPLVGGRYAAGRGVPGGEQPQGGRHGRRAAVPGQRGGPGEPGRHLRVGPVGGQRQVPGAFDRVGGGLGQRGVRGAAPVRGRLRVQRGRDQRMREPYGRALRFGGQQAELGRPRGLRLGVVAARRVQQGQRGTGARTGHEEGVPGLVGQHLQPVQHQGPQRGRHRQRLARPGRDRVLGEGTAQFQREQRVAAAGAVDLADRGAGQAGVAAVVEQRGDLGAGERAESQGEGVGRGGPQLPVVLLVLGAHRAQQLDGGVTEAAGGEPEQFGAGRVEPLEVVGDDQDGPRRGERAQRRQHGEAQREAVALEGGLAAAGERGLQRGALGGGQLVGHVVEDQAEQVGEGQEGEVGFGLGRGAAQHGAGGRAVFRGQCPQHGRLSYSGGPVEQHTAAAVQLLTRRGERLLPADDQVGAASGRLLEVPSHGHRSLRVSCSGQILGTESLNFGGARW